MSILAIKKSTELSDFEKDFSGGLNLNSVIYSDGLLMSFYSDFLLGTASVTVFTLQELNLSDAKAGRVNVITETALSTATLKNAVKSGFYQLYYEDSASTLTDKLLRYTFTNNAIVYISEPFFIK